MHPIDLKAYFILSATFFISEVHSACYFAQGCNPPDGTHPLDGWSPPDDACTTCHCALNRVNIGTCSDFFYTVKKSTTGYFVEEEEEKEVPEEDADSVECISSTTWQYDEKTGEPIIPTGLRHVTYFYHEARTECCSKSSRYGALPPGCKEIKVDECTSRLVLEDDPTKSCDRPGPLYMVG